MKTNEYMEQTEQYVLHTYNRFPLVIDHGEGVHLYDTDGKAYLDFAAGIAVYALGYSNDDYKKAVKDQVDKVIHVSNLFYNVPMGSAAEKLAKASGMAGLRRTAGCHDVCKSTWLRRSGRRLRAE